ncbi:hypothetical protein AAE478_006776 [Parahypoxylon ruwenzoriense]
MDPGQVGMPQGKAPAEPAVDLDVLAAMEDLGNARLEQFASNGDEVSSNHRHHRDIPVHRTSIAQAPLLQLGGDPGLMWKNAIKAGLFDDEDARAVRDLDPLDNGNAHRRNPNFNKTDHRPAGHDGSRTSKGHRIYDPAKPGYHKPKHVATPLETGYKEASLGGLVPPGAEVKRWNPKEVLHETLLIDLASAPRKPTPITPDSNVGREEKKSFSFLRNWTDKMAREPSQQLSPLVSKPSTSRYNKEELLPSGVVGRAAKQPSKKEGASSNGAMDRPSQPAEDQLPHRQIPPTSSKTGESVTRASSQAPVKGTTGFKANQILFRETALVRPITEVDSKASPGQVSLYDLSQGHIVVWELTTEDKRVIMEDIRLFLPLKNVGSVVIIRRQDSPTSGVRASQARFGTIEIATRFVQAAETHRKRLVSSREPIFRATVDDDKVVASSQTNPHTQSASRIHSGEPTGREHHEPQNGHSMSDAAAEQSNAQGTNATKRGLLDVEAIEAVRDKNNLSRDSLHILKTLTEQDYKSMIETSRNLVEVLGNSKISLGAVPLPKYAALQVSVLQLMRDAEFKGLKFDEQQKLAAVVYANVRNRNPRSVGTAEQAPSLKQPVEAENHGRRPEGAEAPASRPSPDHRSVVKGATEEELRRILRARITRDSHWGARAIGAVQPGPLTSGQGTPADPKVYMATGSPTPTLQHGTSSAPRAGPDSPSVSSNSSRPHHIAQGLGSPDVAPASSARGEPDSYLSSYSKMTGQFANLRLSGRDRR